MENTQKKHSVRDFLKPVSYTHIDVYKRQHLDRFSSARVLESEILRQAAQTGERLKEAKETFRKVLKDQKFRGRADYLRARMTPDE